jgi:hypothetical protein
MHSKWQTALSMEDGRIWPIADTNIDVIEAGGIYIYIYAVM